MNSASQVGEIFTKAGETFHKLADMTVLLDASAKDLRDVNNGQNAKQTNGVSKIVASSTPSGAASAQVPSQNVQ